MKKLMELLWPFPRVPSHHVFSEDTAASWGPCVRRVRLMPRGPGPALMHSQLTLQNSLLQGARGTWRPRDGGENVVRVNQAHQVLEQTLRGDQQQGWMNPAPTKKGAISPR